MSDKRDCMEVWAVTLIDDGYTEGTTHEQVYAMTDAELEAFCEPFREDEPIDYAHPGFDVDFLW